MNYCNHIIRTNIPINIYRYSGSGNDYIALGQEQTCLDCATLALSHVKEDLLPSFTLGSDPAKIFAKIKKSHYTIRTSVTLSSVYLITKLFLSSMVSHCFYLFSKDHGFHTTMIWAKSNALPSLMDSYSYHALGLRGEMKELIAIQGEVQILENVKLMTQFEDRFTKLAILLVTVYTLAKMKLSNRPKDLNLGSIYLLLHTIMLFAINKIFRQGAHSLVYNSDGIIDLSSRSCFTYSLNGVKEIAHYATFTIIAIYTLSLALIHHANRQARAIRDVNNHQAFYELRSELLIQKITLEKFV